MCDFRSFFHLLTKHFIKKETALQLQTLAKKENLLPDSFFVGEMVEVKLFDLLWLHPVIELLYLWLGIIGNDPRYVFHRLDGLSECLVLSVIKIVHVEGRTFA